MKVYVIMMGRTDDVPQDEHSCGVHSVVADDLKAYNLCELYNNQAKKRGEHMEYWFEEHKVLT